MIVNEDETLHRTAGQEDRGCPIIIIRCVVLLYKRRNRLRFGRRVRLVEKSSLVSNRSSISLSEIEIPFNRRVLCVFNRGSWFSSVAADE